MSFDRYNLAARLERFGDQLMTACEQGKAIESRVEVPDQDPASTAALARMANERCCMTS